LCISGDPSIQSVSGEMVLRRTIKTALADAGT
jgi:hypothetical protein